MPHRFRLSAFAARRLPGRGPGLWLVLLGLLVHLLLPLGAVSMAGGDGLPGSDICVTAPQAGFSPAAPASSHDSPCCTLHCLGCSGGSLPASPPALVLGPEAPAAIPWVPAAAWHPASHPSPFAARAPPPLG
jgi:hypothetical protein